MVFLLSHIAGWSRYMRSSLLDVVRADYIRTAMAKGLRERVILARHAVKNAMIPVVSIMALDLAGLFSGAIITETIFSWPGVGQYAYQAAVNLDVPAIAGVSLFVAVVYITLNFVVDVLYGVIDPRIRIT